MAKLFFRMQDSLPHKGPLRHRAVRAVLGIWAYAGLFIATATCSISPILWFMHSSSTARWAAIGVSALLWLALFLRASWNLRQFRRATGLVSFDDLLVLIALLVWGGTATALLVASP
mgnify:CR=1 FL=1